MSIVDGSNYGLDCNYLFTIGLANWEKCAYLKASQAKIPLSIKPNRIQRKRRNREKHWKNLTFRQSQKLR